jgi:hypothetical protein
MNIIVIISRPQLATGAGGFDKPLQANANMVT